MKKVLINGLLLTGNYAGVAYSIEYLLMALSRLKRPELALEILVPSDYTGALSDGDNIKITPVGLKAARVGRILYEHLQIPRYFTKQNFDLYHAPAYILPQYSSVPAVVTIHDLIAVDFPELCQNETAVYFNLCLPRTIRAANKILTVSEKVKHDILNRYPRTPAEKIEVVHHGIHPRFYQVTEPERIKHTRLRYDLPERFILYVGNIEPKKNLETLILGFNAFRQLHKEDYGLVIAGRQAWKFDEVNRLISCSAFREEIRLLGYVHENDLPVLYSQASVFVFPSIYEGFGLPVLEAMACGCPVIIAEAGSLPEISGGFAEMIAPKDVMQLRDTLARVLCGHYPVSRSRAAIEWSNHFTWEKAALKTLKIYQQQLSQETDSAF
jgi:glycosyltransferase involved in cell wall biosynthesis